LPDKANVEKGKKGHSHKRKAHDEESHGSKRDKKKSSTKEKTKGDLKGKHDSEEEEKNQVEDRKEYLFKKHSVKKSGKKTKIGASQDLQKEENSPRRSELDYVHLND